MHALWSFCISSEFLHRPRDFALDLPLIESYVTNKNRSGACPKSFGFNAARLAGIPEPVITDAQRIATQFEQLSDRFHIFGKLLQSKGGQVDQLCAKLANVLAK